ncbi:MAG: PAS and helix-turn-helix domain-containing protein [Chloroflexi bacterium]|nr:PAS and helix-turn-helix domain-containing protein [Chloroflexota bacterium]
MAENGSEQTTKIAFQDMVTHDGVFAVDSRQRILYWSTSAENLLGHRSQDVTGRLCYEVIGGKDSRNYRFCRRNCPVMANARRGRPTPDYDILCVVPDGEERWLNMSVAIPKRSKGQFHVLHLFRDVTSRRRTEDFARRASEALRRLIGEEDGAVLVSEEYNPPPMPKLSRREMEVLRLLATGLTTKQIASTLTVQPVTARNHIARLLTKLGVENRLQAVVYASERRLI